MSLPFKINIAPWDVDAAGDYTNPYQRYDMEIGGAGTLTVQPFSNKIDLLLNNGGSIFSAGTDLSGYTNPIVTIGDSSSFSNTKLAVKGSIVLDMSGGSITIGDQVLTQSKLAALLALVP